jgi:hypothetical protein
MTKTFTIRGQKIRSASQRRFIVVVCRPADYEGRRWDYAKGDYVPETYKAFRPTIIRRSDDVVTARKERDKFNAGPGAWVIVVDTMSGEHFHPEHGWTT